MTRRVVQKLCAEKVCVDFLAPSDEQGSIASNYFKARCLRSQSEVKAPPTGPPNRRTLFETFCFEFKICPLKCLESGCVVCLFTAACPSGMAREAKCKINKEFDFANYWWTIFWKGFPSDNGQQSPEIGGIFRLILQPCLTGPNATDCTRSIHDQ